jgi:Ca2+-binding RTX toxin-like protein
MKITGTAANDTLVGTAEYDIISGGAGDDLIDGGAGNDKMAGQDGNDTFRGGAGADQMDGGAGVDSVDYSGSTAGVLVSLNTGAGIGGDATGDTLVSIENLVGSPYADTLTGNAGTNRLDGGFGNDRLTGGAGADVLVGAVGNDQLTGGLEADTFVFATYPYGPPTDGDVITDFQVGVDVLQFQRVYWGWGGVDGLEDLTFSQAGADTMISYGSGASIALRNVDMQQLLANAAHDFLFT